MKAGVEQAVFRVTVPSKQFIKGQKMSVMRILGRAGDTEFKWDPATGEGLESARGAFEEKIRRGYLAFIEGPNGEGSELIRSFEPRAGSIILAPRLVGG